MPPFGDGQHGIPVIFDLETTDFDETAEIIQIAAKSHEREFNVYICPTQDVNPEATTVTGLSTADDCLYLHGKIVETTPALIAYIEFIKFLKSISTKVILVAHYGVKFDAPHILRAMEKFGLSNAFESVVMGFVDSIVVLKSLEQMRSRVKSAGSFKLVTLANDYLSADERAGQAHNAIVDVRLLGGLLKKFNIHDTTLRSFVVPNAKIWYKRSMQVDEKVETERFSVLKDELTVCKLTSAGLTLDLLVEIYENNGENGVKELLGVDINGQPMVTRDTEMVGKVCAALRNYIICSTDQNNCI